jgi:hypothetical protein
VHFVTQAQQIIGKITAVLSRDAGNQSSFRHARDCINGSILKTTESGAGVSPIRRRACLLFI